MLMVKKIENWNFQTPQKHTNAVQQILQNSTVKS